LVADNVEPSLREAALYLNGQIAAAGDDWTKIREAFAKLLAEFPNSENRLPAEYWIAEADYRQGRYDDAQKEFEALIPQIQGRGENWTAMVPLRLAQILARQKKWSEAYVVASKLEAERPDFPQRYEVDYLLGRCLAEREEWEEARRRYRKVVHSPVGGKTETAALAQWMTAESYAKQKDYEAALREFLKVEADYAYPNWQAGALLQAGKCQELLKRPQDAAKFYRRVLDDYPPTSFADEAKQRWQAISTISSN
jgi:cellulose synthase operon protein C